MRLFWRTQSLIELNQVICGDAVSGGDRWEVISHWSGHGHGHVWFEEGNPDARDIDEI